MTRPLGVATTSRNRHSSRRATGSSSSSLSSRSALPSAKAYREQPAAEMRACPGRCPITPTGPLRSLSAPALKAASWAGAVSLRNCQQVRSRAGDGSKVATNSSGACLPTRDPGAGSPSSLEVRAARTQACRLSPGSFGSLSEVRGGSWERRESRCPPDVRVASQTCSPPIHSANR